MLPPAMLGILSVSLPALVAGWMGTPLRVPRRDSVNTRQVTPPVDPTTPREVLWRTPQLSQMEPGASRKLTPSLTLA